VFGGEWQASSRLNIKARGGYWAKAYNDEIDAVANQYGLTSVGVNYNNSSGAPNITISGDPTNPAGINNFQIQHKPLVNTQTEKNFQLDGQYDVGGILQFIKFGVQRRLQRQSSIFHDATITYDGYGTTPGIGDIKTRSYATGTGCRQHHLDRQQCRDPLADPVDRQPLRHGRPQLLQHRQSGLHRLSALDEHGHGRGAGGGHPRCHHRVELVAGQHL
jgi:hypothetical protein